MEPFGWNFEAVRKHQSDSWNNILNRVRIYSNDYREKVRFYTNLYRAFCRNTFSDADRRWVDAAGNIQKAGRPGCCRFGMRCLLEYFWNLNQVWNLIAPEWSSRWVKSQLAMYDANGFIGKRPQRNEIHTCNGGLNMRFPF